VGRLVDLCRTGVALLDLVNLELLRVELAEVEPERDTTDEGEDGHDTVVPCAMRREEKGEKKSVQRKEEGERWQRTDEEGVLRERKEGLAEGSSDSGGEETGSHNHRTHRLGRLGVGVLEGGDGGEDFGESDEDVGGSLDPDVETGNEGLSLASGGLGTANRLLVDLRLDDSGAHHSECSAHEASEDTLDGFVRGKGRVSIEKRKKEEKGDEREKLMPAFLRAG
jgi:hypothetical protein